MLSIIKIVITLVVIIVAIIAAQVLFFGVGGPLGTAGGAACVVVLIRVVWKMGPWAVRHLRRSPA